MTAGLRIAPPPAPRQQSSSPRMTRLLRPLLVSAVLSSLLYAAMLVVVPFWWDDYSSASRTVSELSAIGAPTRPLWVALAMIWTLLYALGGAGVMASAGARRSLRAAGVMIIVQAVIGAFWPPMHQREVLAAGGATITDTLHLVWALNNGVLALLAMAFAAAGLGARFRGYSLATIAVLLVTGVMTSLDAPRVEANLPTPLVGVWERINIAAWLIWVMALAVVLIRRLPERRATT